MPISDERLAHYGRSVAGIAEYDIERMPQEPHAAVEYTVLGTALYDPILARAAAPRPPGRGGAPVAERGLSEGQLASSSASRGS